MWYLVPPVQKVRYVTDDAPEKAYLGGPPRSRPFHMHAQALTDDDDLSVIGRGDQLISPRTAPVLPFFHFQDKKLFSQKTLVVGFYLQGSISWTIIVRMRYFLPSSAYLSH